MPRNLRFNRGLDQNGETVTENISVDDNYYALILAIENLTKELRRVKSG